MRAAALLAALSALAALPGPVPAAAAADVSEARFQALLAAAATDPAALAELRGVTAVNGARVYLRPALEGASGAELDRRLAELGRASATAEQAGLPDAETARAYARDAVGAGVEAPPEADTGGEDGLAFDLGLDAPSWALLLAAAIALAVGGVVAIAIARRRVLDLPRAIAGPTRVRRPAPLEALEAEAAEAERAGDFAAAVRLRFRAGLARLDRAGALRMRPSLTASQAARELGSPALSQLAQAYERIAFGGRPAQRSDAEAARAGWTTVLAEARR